MSSTQIFGMPVIDRRAFGFLALGSAAAAAFTTDRSSAQGPVRKMAEEVSGELSDLKDDMREEVAYLLAMECYVYGFPLVIMDLTNQVVTATAKAGEYSAPMNQFLKMRGFVSPDFKNIVRISVNSIWSGGVLDLGNEPMVVTFPDGEGIPTAFRGVNMWTDVFGTGGSRQPETNAGNYLFAEAAWKGTVPQDVKKVFRSSTRYAWFLVEMAAKGPQDFPAIHALQDQLTAVPLSAWGKPYTPPSNVPVDPTVDLTATPYDQVRLMTGEMFFKRLALLLKNNPPYPADGPILGKLKKLGVEPGKDFDAGKLDPAVRKGINAAPAEVWKRFATGPYTMAAPNGWLNMLTIGRFGTDYQTRAYVAYMGLGAGLAEDVIYPTAFVDGDGNALDGAYDYVIHFEKSHLDAAQNGVWSLSQYRENFYVHNPIERFGLLPSTPKYNPDGSLDVYVQARSPGPDKEGNWLPAPPSGMFNLSIRIYNPSKEVLSPTYKWPPVKKTRPA